MRALGKEKPLRRKTETRRAEITTFSKDSRSGTWDIDKARDLDEVLSKIEERQSRLEASISEIVFQSSVSPIAGYAFGVQEATCERDQAIQVGSHINASRFNSVVSASPGTGQNDFVPSHGLCIHRDGLRVKYARLFIGIVRMPANLFSATEEPDLYLADYGMVTNITPTATNTQHVGMLIEPPTENGYAKAFTFIAAVPLLFGL